MGGLIPPLIRGREFPLWYDTRLYAKKDTAEVNRNFGVSKDSVNNNVNWKQ